MSSFQRTVNSVKREFVGLLEIDLSSFEVFVDFVEAFHDQLTFMMDTFQVYCCCLNVPVFLLLFFCCCFLRSICVS